MRNKYTISEFLSNIYALLYTKCFYRGARLVRRPVYVRGKSSLIFGKGLTAGYACRFDLPGKYEKTLIIGERCEMGDNVHIVALEQVSIGHDCLMASKIFISDTSHGVYSGETESCTPFTKPNDRPLISKPVIIGNNVWIGENVCILLGVTIGNGCIIGANSVVNKDIPPGCIVAGNPAKVIKKYNCDNRRWEKVQDENTTNQ